jgi:gliding motility-associated-like protein
MKVLCSFLVSLFFIAGIYCQTINPPGPINLCQGSSQVLTVTGVPGGTTFQWQNPLGTNISGATLISYTANSAGNYYVILNGGTMPGDTLGPVVVTVLPKPTASFTFNPNNVCATTPVNFTNTSTGSGLTYLWDFGDPNSGANNTSTLINPVHNFIGTTGTGAESFTVKLIATSSNGCKDSITATVTNLQRPGTELGGTGATTYNGLPYFQVCSSNTNYLFTFINQSSTVPNSSYRIIWGDNSTDFINTIFTTTSHTYNAGTYTLRFIVAGINGCTDTAMYTVFLGTNPAIGFENPGSTSICTGTSLTFPITGTASNTPGTIYTVTFNDGSPPVVFPHPPPASVTHQFNSSSCGTNSSNGTLTFNNSFSASIVASNPCGTSSVNIVPIYVSRKPVASFTIAPKDTVCVNTVVTLTNTSVNGTATPSSPTGSCTNGKQVWSVTPPTGWTISSGTRGNDNGFNDPALWTNGTAVLQLNFTAPGVYTIKLKVGANTLCGIDSIIKTICVNPTPIASFTVNQNIGCAPLTVNTTNNSPAPSCGQNSYLWSVSYSSTAGCLPNTNGASFINGTNASSVNPQFLFSNPGIYTISLTTIAPAAACSSLVSTQQITVKGKPVVSINALASTCANQSVNPSAAVTCYINTATTYLWSFPGGAPSSATTLNPGTIVYSTPGTYTITLSVTNECGTTTTSTQLTVNTVTVSNAGPTQTQCGTTVTLAGNTPVIGTGLWTRLSGPNTPVITTPTSPTTTVTGMVVGTYVFRWTITNGACVSFSDVTITIVSGPTVAAAGPAQSLCLATSTTLSGNTPLVGTGSWAFVSGPNTPTINTPTSPTTSVTGLIPGVYTFRWTISFANCTPSTSNVIVTIYDNPTVSNAGPNQTICSTTTTMAANSAVIGTGLWIKLSGPAATITTPTSPTTTITGMTAGTYVFQWTISNGICPPSSSTVQITVSPAPTTAAAGPNQTVCAATSITLAGNTAVIGTGVWAVVSGPNIPVITTPGSPISTVTSLIPGVYVFSWTITSGVCPPSISNVVINVLSDIQNNISAGILTICSGQTVLLTGNSPTGGTGVYSYQWQQSADGVIWTDIVLATSQNYLTSALLISTYFRRQVTSLPCQKFSNIIFISVQAAITNNNISADQSICINTAAAIIIGVVPSGGNSIFGYQWQQSIDGGLTWNDIIGATNKDYNPGVLVQTIKYRRIVSTALCSGPQANSSNIVTVTVNPNSKALYNPIDTIGCAPFLITAANVNLQTFPTRNTQYYWYVNNTPIGVGPVFPGTTINNPDDSIVLKLRTTSLFGCLEDSISHKFKTRKRPIPSFTMSDSVGCGPLSVNFINTTLFIGLFTYQWNFGNGVTSTAVQPGSVVFQPNPNFGDTTYFVQLKVFSDCDTIIINKTIRVQSKPKALFTPNRAFGCSPFTVIFTNTSKGFNNAYVWNFGDGTILNTNSIAPVSHTYNTGIRDTFYVKLRATNNCGSDSFTYAIVVSPNTINLLFGVNGTQLMGCVPHTVSFINNSSGASSFFWNFGDGSPIVNTTRNIDTVVHTYLIPGVFTATLRGTNGCADTSASLIITVFQKPLPSFTADKYLLCIGDTVRFTNLTDSATSYLWQFGDGGTSTLLNPSHRYSVPGLYRVKLTAYRGYPSGSVCSDTTSRLINVLSSWPGIFDLTDSTGPCAPFTITFFNRNLPAVSATWDFGDGTTGNGNTITHTYQRAGTYLVRLVTVAPGGCTYTSQKTVTISGPDGVLLYNGGFYCNSQTVRFEATVSNTDTLLWNFGDGNILATTQRIVFHSYAFAGSYVPKVTLLSNSGCQFPIQGIDTIKIDYIKSGFSWTEQRFCGYTKVQFRDTSNAYFGLQNFSWDFGDGTFGSGNLISHDYTTTGNYTVKLIVTGNSNCKDTISKPISIVINSKPVASIQADTSGCAYLPVTFNGIIQSNDPVNIISWSVSNGVTGSGTPIIVNFALPGTYTVRLVTGTIYGCYDTAYHFIRINPTPNVTTNNNLNLCLGNTVQLITTGASQYLWSPSQGLSCNNCPNPIASPTTTTAYVVRGMNTFGCNGYDTVVISVIQPIKVTVSSGDSICIGKSVQLMASGASKYLWTPSIGLSATNIPNPVATPTSTITYKVVGYDNYNCFTDTGYVTVAVGLYPTVNLGSDLSLSTGTQLTLNSTIQNGPIRDWLWTPSNNLSCNTCPKPVATIKENVTYIVKATTYYGCSALDTIKIKVFCEGSQVFIPNTFTPDGDGLNDIMMVRGTGILTVKSFRIFNRWGAIVFERNNFPPNNTAYGWDGKVTGKPVPPDVFVYTAEVICDNGTPYIFKGNITIIK